MYLQIFRLPKKIKENKMKTKISAFLLIMSLMFVIPRVFVFCDSESDTIQDNQKINAKSGNYLLNDVERCVVEHSEFIELEYYINGISSINNMSLSYEVTNNSIGVNLMQTSNDGFEVRLISNNIGEDSVEIFCTLNLNNGEQITLNDEIFIYSREDYDFLSKASMLDARFYCYVYITNTDSPSFEEYDEFYSSGCDNGVNNNMSAINSQEQSQIMSMDNINVCGTITWVDEQGRSHNAINVTVEIIDEDILGINNVLETVTTNDMGYYNASVSNSSFLENGGNDIKLRISTQGGNIKVVNNFGVVYEITQANPHMNFSGTYLNLNFEIDASDYSNATDKEITYAFRVHQAMNLGAEYVETKKGSRLDTIKVKFPTAKGTSCYNGTNIYILEEDKNDWDVMLHEYGHYVSDYYNIDDSPGGDHGIGDCLNFRYGKSDGMRLSWSEGWASYFSISSQLEMNAVSLNIENVGDTEYTDTDDLRFYYCIETPRASHYRYGESNEGAISAVLFDLADGVNDENVNFGYTYIWNLICNKQPKNFSSFINDLYSSLSDFERAEIGEILSAYYVAPSLTRPNNDFICKWNIPTFSWLPQGGEKETDVNYENNLFTIVFYDKDKQLIYETPQITGSSYTPTVTEWREILSEPNEFIYWSVKAYQTTEYTTGAYYSCYRKIYIPILETLYLDSDVSGSIDEGDVKWYKFVAPKNGTYVFETTSDYDTYGELFSAIVFNNSTTNILIDGSDYDDEGEGNNFKIEYNLDYRQVVYLRVKGYNNQEVDNYTLNIFCIHHDHTYEYESVNSQYHVLICHCGQTTGEQERHIVTGGSSDLIGNGRYKTCICCGAAVDTWGGGIFPIIKNNQIIYLSHGIYPADNELMFSNINSADKTLFNNIQYSLNGSYKTCDGTIVLVKKDIESYFDGTLIFYDVDDITQIE